MKTSKIAITTMTMAKTPTIEIMCFPTVETRPRFAT
jgi:hypothetical protein